MNIRSKLSSLREYLTPLNYESNFRKTGEILPDEFVLAGDYLVLKFPTWAWGSCPKPLQKKFLPPEKQFLVTRHVPSYRRYAAFVPETGDGAGGKTDAAAADADSDAEWVPLVSQPVGAAVPLGPATHDLDALMDDAAEDAASRDDIDDYTHISSGGPGLRRYDLYIAYLTSYRVPKVYLVGFDDGGIPLLPPQMYEDISGDHKDKTATIEALPMAHSTMAVSIHPCKHAAVMRVFMEHARLKKAAPQPAAATARAPDGRDLLASGTPEPVDMDDGGIRVDQYIVIFLKFIASVTPGIEYDFTMDAL
ncbi:hypothetical protein METBIDRAFT_10991 [Metschnikowia bicuspidata var. bicuspidata NRRL YB-4993]|uniref:Autophagy-related protein 3 n=1 Tax=Metschnikowia bicuspidata var. bicuspidata NRRL YB-4993 TaxID=869754 RepID=A0A1A0HDX6_9ASCO|nr:hypothetical protein METBIDRAFT_10991 [Metschnikowia bicuspidata var. bicuspidata NRRL YB-4993]OBA22102.1 hypothetical protein METBIDRAFT_10991 [Metschnikowia bicuspidata var. bicuspidata NRRL YB-4993]